MTPAQLPNAITWARIAAVVPLVWAILRGEHVVALAVALFAAVTDALDGFLARRYGWQSRFGSLLDPIADKLLLSACYVALWWVAAMPGWLLALVLLRDAAIVAGALAFHWLVAPVSGTPTLLGKLCTALQIAFALLLLLHLAGLTLEPAVLQACIWTVATATIASGIDYIARWSTRAMRTRRAA